jgi:hypothetical protein
MRDACTKPELDHIQDEWGLRFPSDLVNLMRERRPLIAGGFDWLATPSEKIRHALEWPFEGFWFDVQHNDLWWPEWGPRPDNSTDQKARLAEVFAVAPKLIPLFGHRYLPETPTEGGNPVFSVYQSDVIYYGENLLDWLIREQDPGTRVTIDPMHPPKEIAFWSEVVRRNN